MRLTTDSWRRYLIRSGCSWSDRGWSPNHDSPCRPLSGPLYFPAAFVSPRKCLSVQPNFTEDPGPQLSETPLPRDFPTQLPWWSPAPWAELKGSLDTHSIPAVLTQVRAKWCPLGDRDSQTRARDQETSLQRLALPEGPSLGQTQCAPGAP